MSGKFEVCSDEDAYPIPENGAYLKFAYAGSAKGFLRQWYDTINERDPYVKVVIHVRIPPVEN